MTIEPAPFGEEASTVRASEDRRNLDAATAVWRRRLGVFRGSAIVRGNYQTP
jgi:hypothetical protein